MKTKKILGALLVAMLFILLHCNHSHAMSPHFSFGIDSALPPLRADAQYCIRSQSVVGMFTVKDERQPGFDSTLIPIIKKELMAAAEKEYSKLQETVKKNSHETIGSFKPGAHVSVEYNYGNGPSRGVAYGIAVVRYLGGVMTVVVVSTANNRDENVSVLYMSEADLNTPSGYIIRTTLYVQNVQSPYVGIK